MRPLVPCLSSIVAAALLQGCASTPPAQLATTPLLRISDGDGDNPAYAYRLGRAYEDQGDLVRASAAYARSLALDPAQLDARNAQAVLLAKQGQLSRAAELLRQLAADFPTAAQPLSNLGYIHHLQGHDALAATTLRSALALAPDYALARANLALLDADTPGAAVARRLPATAPAALPLTTTPSVQLQLVQLAPNEFRLQAPAMVAEPAAAPVASSVAPAELAAASAAAPERLQIVNGFGAPGVAAKARDLLRRHGFAATSVTNQRGYRQAQTVIEYVPGQQSRARALRAALPGPVTLAPVATLPRQLTLRLVLGQDHDRITTPNLLARLDRAAPAFNQESP